MILSSKSIKLLIFLILVKFSAPRDEFADYTASTHKISYATVSSEKYSGGEDARGQVTQQSSKNAKIRIHGSEMDTFIERREMRRRARSKTKKRSNRLELRRRRSARRNRSEMNLMDRRGNRRGAEIDNRHITMEPTRQPKNANSSKSPGTTDRDTDEEKQQKENIFTRPPSAFGNAPPGSSATIVMTPNFLTSLCLTIFMLHAFS